MNKNSDTHCVPVLGHGFLTALYAPVAATRKRILAPPCARRPEDTDG